jgi:lipoprotein-anchoring transpeptidase ErfK/SrfK
MTKRIHIAFNDVGEGRLECKGYRTFRCLGMKGLRYPIDIVIDPTKDKSVKQHPYFSRTYTCGFVNNQGVPQPCRMNYAIRIWGQQGVFIHEWPAPTTYVANGGPTHGCIHLEIGNAKNVYDWVDGRTRVTMQYPW